MTGAYLFVLLALCLGFVQNEPIKSAQPAIVENLRSNANSRVVAGWPAKDGQIPYQISMRMVNANGRVNGCGGSVIHHKWILTAAHCVANQINFIVRLGLTNLTRPEWMVETTSKHSHPRYIEFLGGVQTDDIALLGLNQEIPYGPTIQPVRMQNSGQKNIVYTGVQMVVSGYGLTDDQKNGGTSSEILNWVYLRGITNQECRSWYGGSSIIKEQTICAEFYNETAQSSCQGDSGGPLTIVDKDGVPSQVGVVSFGSTAGCNSPYPSAYVRPGHYHDWFFDVTGINFDWNSADIEPKDDVEQPSIVEPVSVKDIEFQ